MIERLPLDIFDDKSPEPAPEAREQPQEQAAARAHAEPPGGGSFDVSCQWCGEWFDNERETCPHCGGAHRKLASPDEDTPELSCQWCLTTIEPGAERCPQCGARVVVPGQQIASLNVPESELIPLEQRFQQLRTQQMLAGMMLGGGLDNLFGGLIGLALHLFDD